MPPLFNKELREEGRQAGILDVLRHRSAGRAVHRRWPAG